MGSLGRWIRGAVGMGLAWAVAWSGAGIVPARIARLDSDLPFSLLFAPFGFVAGTLFFGILAALERRRRLDRVSLSWFAGSGALSGLLLAVFVTVLRGEAREVLVFGPVLALVGAVCAAGSLAVARRSWNRSLPHPGGGSA